MLAKCLTWRAWGWFKMLHYHNSALQARSIRCRTLLSLFATSDVVTLFSRHNFTSIGHHLMAPSLFDVLVWLVSLVSGIHNKTHTNTQNPWCQLHSVIVKSCQFLSWCVNRLKKKVKKVARNGQQLAWQSKCKEWSLVFCNHGLVSNKNNENDVK